MAVRCHMCYVWVSVILLLFLPVQLPGVSTSSIDEELPRIAVIGAGLGGTSSSYYLRQLFGDHATIDIYEAKEVGGRLATVNLGGQVIETGGSVIHPKNYYMVNFTELLGLEKKIVDDSGSFGIYDGEQFQFQSSEYFVITAMKAFWHYGRDMHRLSSWVNDNILEKFSRIYGHQLNGYAFTTVKDLLLSMDPSIANLTTRSLQEVLEEEGFSERFIKELVTVAVRTNYGQGTDVHAFVGAVSWAGTSGLWAVNNGNKLVAEGLLKKSQAQLIPAKVTKILLLKESNSVQYELEYEPTDAKNEDDSTQSSIYDIVIVAAPLNSNVSNLKFEDFSSALHSFVQPFQRTVSSFLNGQINASFFHCEREEDLPTSIHINKEPYFINSMNKIVKDVWKIFSRDILTEAEKELLFKKVDQTVIYDWQAYPKYSSSQSLPSFVLYDQLYYVNAIESAASAMEMSIIGGRNVALLAYNHWHSLLDFVDETPATQTEAEKVKKEL